MPARLEHCRMNSSDHSQEGPIQPLQPSALCADPKASTPNRAGSRSLEEVLVGIVGRSNVLSDDELRRPYEVDWTRRFSGRSALVVRPGSTDEVSDVLAACSQRSVSVVTQGGNTGLVGASIPPDDTGTCIVLSTRRLATIQPVDKAASQVTVGAGATLAGLQQAVAAEGLAFPVDLAARDSATVGGMIATNAGGLHVIRYGAMRQRVLGVEAVLADGTVISHLGGLLKDNTGYDLSQLLVGSEGTLAVVTAARLSLVPETPHRAVALLGLTSVAAALEVIDVLRGDLPGLQAAELFFEDGLALVCSHARLAPPLAQSYPVYLLVEVAGRTDCSDDLFEALSVLDLPEDASAIGVDTSTVAKLWEYRERHTEAVSAIGIPHKLDVTLPHSRLPTFEKQVRLLLERDFPAAVLVLFGHAGDGNLHVNVVGPDPDDDAVDEAVLTLVASLGGSISAEHGIGRAKARWLGLSRSASEIATMKAVKTALDPLGILNPATLFTGA